MHTCKLGWQGQDLKHPEVGRVSVSSCSSLGSGVDTGEYSQDPATQVPHQLPYTHNPCSVILYLPQV